MKAFMMTLLVAAASADQSHSQSIKLGNSPTVSHAVTKPHGQYTAIVSSQPHAAPQSVHGYGGYEKQLTAVHAPAATPSYAAPSYGAVNYAPRPVYRAPAATYASRPVYRAPAATYASRPVYRAPVATYAPKPVYRAPAATYAPKPVYHAPSSYQGPSYDEPANYAYNYGVSDDYSGANFNAEENRNDYATSGSYSVALPDGRTQTVNYRVDDAYSGYVADVQYSGYAAAPAYKAAPAYTAAPAYKAAPRYAPARYA